ncbi:MAG: cryptochrome/photolyase family protein, partial [Proteobacteria bacterium]|nr:cryptochrome/photolyase family protein [Pseudomonadota bacterium]
MSDTPSALSDLDPAVDVVLMAEVLAEATYIKHHKQKLAPIFTGMRNFAQRLMARGVVVGYAYQTLARWPEAHRREIRGRGRAATAEYGATGRRLSRSTGAGSWTGEAGAGAGPHAAASGRHWGDPLERGARSGRPAWTRSAPAWRPGWPRKTGSQEQAGWPSEHPWSRHPGRPSQTPGARRSSDPFPRLAWPCARPRPWPPLRGLLRPERPRPAGRGSPHSSPPQRRSTSFLNRLPPHRLPPHRLPPHRLPPVSLPGLRPGTRKAPPCSAHRSGQALPAGSWTPSPQPFPGRVPWPALIVWQAAEARWSVTSSSSGSSNRRCSLIWSLAPPRRFWVRWSRSRTSRPPSCRNRSSSSRKGVS